MEGDSMRFEMVVNELSFSRPAKDIVTARERMSRFVHILRAPRSIGGKLLRTHENFHSDLLTQDYRVAQWLKDREVSREERVFLKTLATKIPFLADSPSLEDKSLGFDFYFKGKTKARGLGVAYLLDTLAVSILSERQWDAGRLALTVSNLDEDEKIVHETESIHHASRVEHVREHAPWIDRKQKASIKNGADLWKRRKELLPSLCFCEEAGNNIKGLGKNDALLRQVIRHLFELEEYCRVWNSGNFSAKKLPGKATPESPATLRRFGKERTFVCPDGREHAFSWHLRITPLDWRLYFHPDEPGKMLIGYIGKHLRIVSK
ncbi:MAG: hypothetical protein GY862_01175 [Gammaproteobacteria bacterium]|nr:hypothetical protein [Gammaproteobacteria bacterium]